MPDEHRDDVPEDLSINDQESIVEIILEIGMGMENAIPEQEDADGSQETSQKKQLKTDLHFVGECTPFQLRNSLVFAENFLPFLTDFLPSGYRKTLSPPPKFFS
ncbi:hypothetical protein [Cyclobacterium lianum]|nr:hypothetical protein [Cyclobacterium lianum]